MKIWGTVRRPAFSIISARRAGSRLTRIFSISVTPRARNTRSAMTQYGQKAVEYMITLVMDGPCLLFLHYRQIRLPPRVNAATQIMHVRKSVAAQDRTRFTGR